jgi:hypothetical protein
MKNSTNIYVITTKYTKHAMKDDTTEPVLFDNSCENFKNYDCPINIKAIENCVLILMYIEDDSKETYNKAAIDFETCIIIYEYS